MRGRVGLLREEWVEMGIDEVEDTKKTIEIEITGRETGTSRTVAASASAAQTIGGERGIMKGTAPDMTNRGKRPTTVIVKERRNGKIPTVTPTTDLGAKMAMTVREARVLTLLGVDEVVRIHEAAAGILLNAILLMEGRGETKVGEREITSPWTGERLRKVDDVVKKRERWEWCTTKMGECTILERKNEKRKSARGNNRARNVMPTIQRRR